MPASDAFSLKGQILPLWRLRPQFAPLLRLLPVYPPLDAPGYENAMRMPRFVSSPTWDFKLVRILGATASGGCDVAEFLQAVGELRRHDGESWYRAWRHQAETALASATEAEGQGLPPLARGYLLRAANYFRVAPYMLPCDARSAHPHDPRATQCLELSADAFDRATAYMDARVLAVEIPYTDDAAGPAGGGRGDQIALPARLFLPPSRRRLPHQKTPVVVCVGGADSTLQEQYFLLGPQGVELGYAVLVFDGPGQGRMLAARPGGGVYTLRPDYERVVSSVLDRVWSLASERPELDLDLDRVTVVGLALGGYFVLRTAAKDPRVAAVVAGDPIADMWELALTRLPGWFARGWLAGWIPDAVLNAICTLNMRLDPPTCWEFRVVMTNMGQRTPADLLREFRRYTVWGEGEGGREAEAPSGVPEGQDKNAKLSDMRRPPEEDGGASLLRHIKCPVLLTGAKLAVYLDAERGTHTVANGLVNVPDGQLELWVPGSLGEGAMTAKVGAWYRLAGKIFTFLDKQLKVTRPV